MDLLIKEIYNATINGDPVSVEKNVQMALEKALPASEILNLGLIAAMDEVGRLFEEGEYFVPEMLISARAMKSGMSILQPILVSQKVEPVGKVVLGTVKGDLHDIGKNLISMMLEGGGFQIIDLGTDVSAENFLDAINTYHPDIVGMSALLTTTMGNMKKNINYFHEHNVSSRIKVIVGGAPITQNFANDIGADGFSSDASQVVLLAKKLLGKG